MKKILFVLFLIHSVCYPQSGWYQQNSGTSGDLISTFFTDSLNGVIVGKSGTILRTTDGGDNWQQINSGTTNNLSYVSFVNSQVGMIVGAGGTILRTENGGENWLQQTSGVTGTLEAISFYDENNGVAVGGNTILRTTNGGQNWEILLSGALQGSFYRVKYIDHNNIVIIFYYSSTGVHKSTDAGLTWFTQLIASNMSSGRLTDAMFIDSNVGFVIGWNGYTSQWHSYICRTTDSGTNWQTITENTIVPFLNSIHFSSINIGTVVGDNGNIYRTTDGGSSWNQQLANQSYDLNGVFFYNENIGTAVGEGGRILRTTNGGITPNSTEWTEYKIGPPYINLQSVCFPSSLIGFCTGPSSVYKTINRGISWSESSNGVSSLWPYDVWFIDSNNGSIVGQSITSPQFGGIMFNTTNGGQDWQMYIFNQNLNEMSYRIARGIYYIDNLRRIIVAQYGRILYSLDGGVNWTKSDSVTAWDLNDLSFPTNDFGYVVGDKGTILKSTNSGISWNVMQSNTNDNLYGVSFKDALNGTVVGVNGKILKTTDGGTSWTTQQSGTNNNLNKIAFDQNNNGIIVGNMGTILISRNGGEIWEQENSGTSLNLNAISITDSLAIAVGDNGTILGKSDITLDAEKEESEIPSNYYLSQNYPNPFNPSTTIKYQIPEISFVTITVYDILGREVATLVNEEKPAGSYEVQFSSYSEEGRNLTSGIYFYQLKANNYVETKKMILLK